MSSSLNIVLFGETGVGKSSVINMIAGRHVADTSPDVPRCTMSFEPCSFPVNGRTFHIWETVGLDEPEMGVNNYFPAIEQTCELVHNLSSQGGVDLLLFCIRGNRVTATTQSNYRLFLEVLCKCRVPIVLVVTQLEREAEMEQWWVRNAESLEKCGIKAAGHACVTGLPTHSKYRESQRNIARLLEGYDGHGKFNMSPEGWLVEILRLFGLFAPLQKSREKDIVKVLTKRCRLDPKVAEELAIKLGLGSSRIAARVPPSFTELEHLGDVALGAKRYDEAIPHYSAALSFVSSQTILIKRSKAWLATRSWKEALDDANQAVTLDPLSPWGYEMKHAALHKIGDYDSAIEAFETMLSKMKNSSDPDVQQKGDEYISPSSIQATIRKVVQRTIDCFPRVLINTITGRLHDRSEHASAFESLPIFKELVSSMTKRIDYVRIKREVRQHFRYVMLSHKWEANEPLFQKVIHITVYELDQSPTHDKLRTFCKIVRDAGFSWAWSDTCCIDKSDHFVLQEALVAMFRWYQGSTMVIVFLRGVRHSSPCGALAASVWNTRAWTLQEYIAAKVIRFYTEDWTIYRDLDLPNHKESPEIISEMEQATGVSAQQLMVLSPGLSSIREKLRLASTRETTLVEDAGYSLLGIFSVTGIPAIYGEGESSLGRLLAHVLTGSGDVSILAWIGESGSFNSCLPTHITVFKGPATSHLPRSIPDADMEGIIAAMQPSPYPSMFLRLYGQRNFDLNAALRLYDRLNELPAAWFAAGRMKLPCIVFQLPPPTPNRTRAGYVYRVDTVAFGTVEIKTRRDLSRMNSLYIVHPWLDALLGHEDDVAPPPNTDDEEFFDNRNDGPWLPEPELRSHSVPIRTVAGTDKATQARRLVARLRQPFGALLLTLVSTGGRAVDYKRVAADNLITVQLQEDVSLVDILDNVRILDVL